ncbi:MAG: hypothetical protein ACXAEX_21350 [Promethearchaeota archaeon]|jgi:hypothetical protein
MIEEEDDEDILKKGVTFKSILKNLVSIILIILGAVFIYTGIIPDQVYSWSVGFMLICFGATLLQMQKSPSEPIKQTLTILICNLCGITKVRNYEKGDFIFRKTGQCDSCNDIMEIKQIYSVKLKKPTEPNKLTEDSKEKKKKEKSDKK